MALTLLRNDSVEVRHLRAQPLDLRKQLVVLAARALRVL
jgi:hypothetical protein